MAQRRYLQVVAYKSSLLSWVCLLVLVYHTKAVAGRPTITLSPRSVAPVCHVGDPLQLTCTASVEFISWNIIMVSEQGRDQDITAFSNSRDPSQTSPPIIINSTIFTFMRTSAQYSTPLISTLTIDSVSIGLNGTVVSCKDAVNTTSSASTTIRIVDFDDNLYSPPLDTTILKEYKEDNVTITVEWIQQVYTVNDVTVVPWEPIMSTGNTSRQLTIQYNTEYNLSLELEATAPCRPNAITFIILNYANCGHPDELLSAINDSVLSIELEDYDGLPLEGSTVRLRCLSGLELVGEPNSATCTANGTWEPSNFTGLTCTNSSDSLVGGSINTVLIGSISAVVTVCIVATFILVAVILYRKRLTEKQSSVTRHMESGKSTAKHPSSHKVVYQKKGSLWIENKDQCPQEELVYADVTVASKHKKKTATTNKSAVTTTQLDLGVEYSAINFKLCNDKPVNMEKHPTHDDSLDVTMDKLLALLREEVGPRWYDFGDAVGIDNVVLDSIAKTTFPENCLVEMLDYWLKYFHDDEKLTWADVATALRDINLQELAYHIEQQYATDADTSALQQAVSSTVTPSAPLKTPGSQAYGIPVPPPRY